MRRLITGSAVAAAAAVLAAAAFAEGVDPTARATFVGSIQAGTAKATLKVRYRCAPAKGVHLWVSAKQTRSGVSATRLMKEGSSRFSSGWWQSHRNAIACNGAWHTGTFTIDRVEQGSKGTLRTGSAWVQFCITTGTTEKNTVLRLSKSGWVHVSA
jgi:hypothetical protein